MNVERCETIIALLSGVDVASVFFLNNIYFVIEKRVDESKLTYKYYGF